MQDRPTAAELTEAVAQFLSEELVSTVSDPRLRFRVLIAANLMQIVTRELRAGSTPLQEEHGRLVALLGIQKEAPANSDDLRQSIDELQRDLCKRIREGEADDGPWNALVAAYAEVSLIEKLRIANPKFLAKM
jgi:hypothetical protein